VTTFTLRVSDFLAANLTSATMRASVDAFLWQPHPLPTDPGPGYERISLTLTETSVGAAAAYLQCSASSALRRIAIDALGGPRRGGATPKVCLPNTSAPASIPWKDTATQGNASQGQAIAGALIQFLCSVLFVGGWLFFISRKKRSVNGA
jgi:hypothetical protein